ncbi:MAG: DNA polymerase III subunit gamma/tau [Candidatus Pacebacteria bacterium]|nr:DNA polymerase III subunit gamma/tau [Candidatus Paceibacterota bacterium]
MSWFLKYRPKKIADLDLTDVRQTFQKMMEAGKLPQTMLFAGPKGTGKTSTSRIIGVLLNDSANEEVVDYLFFKGSKPKKLEFIEPDPETDFAKRVYRGQSFVVQEMDAASNRGIDDVRSLRERIALPPQEGKMAVYILDEVHMLTNEAFNALLKILEEPPSHVVFILATTELHKVPSTIVSRCSTIAFHKASSQEIINRLEQILDQEKIEFEAEALEEIARRSDGSFRDAVKLAELASQQGELSLTNLEAVAGESASVKVRQLVSAVIDKDEQKVSEVFEKLRAQNTDQNYFYRTIFELLHQSLMRSLGVREGQPTFKRPVAEFLLRELLKVDLDQTSPIKFLPMELVLLQIVERAKKVKGDSNNSNGGNDESDDGSSDLDSREDKKNEGEASRSSKPKKLKTSASYSSSSDEKKELVSQINQLVEQDPLESDQLTESEYLTNTVTQDDSLSKVICDRWEELLDSVSAKNSTLAALLRSGKPKSGPNGTAKISVYYRFHQEQLQQPKFKSVIEKCGEELVGNKIQFKFELVDPPSSAELVEVPAKTDKLEAIAKEALM